MVCTPEVYLIPKFSSILHRWAYVQKHNVPLPDEYGRIYEDLEAFWGVSPVDLNAILDEWRAFLFSFLSRLAFLTEQQRIRRTLSRSANGPTVITLMF